MPVLSPEEIYQVARGAGFTPDQAVTFTAIALAESDGRSDAVASRGEHSIGLWQINVAANVRRNIWGDLTDPATNARAAYEISRSGTHLQPWTVTHQANVGTSRDYRRYLDEAEAARSAVTGGAPTGGTTPAPATASATAQPSVDSDGDGVTDAAEIELGRSAVHPDTADAIGQAAAEANAGATSGPAAGAAAPSALDRFLAVARAQAGDRYVFGAETSSSDDDPETFDCSELVQWAAQQAGVEITDGATFQYLALKERGMLIPVAEAANTPGALLFSFSDEPRPGGGRPSSAHVAISLGDGRTIEARGRKYGVDEFPIGKRFEYAALIPGISEGASAATAKAETSAMIAAARKPWLVDSDSDGVVDGAEAVIGTDASRSDSDGDGLSDSAELLFARTNPLVGDTDGDRHDDDIELAFGSDPLQVDAIAPWAALAPSTAPLTGGSPLPDALGTVLPNPQASPEDVALIKDLMA